VKIPYYDTPVFPKKEKAVFKKIINYIIMMS